MINQPLDKKGMCGFHLEETEEDWGLKFSDVKQAMQKLQSKIKDIFKHNRYRYYYYNQIDKAFQEEIGEGLLC